VCRLDHCVWRDSIIECIEAGVDVIDHGDGTDERCIELMAEHGVTWVPSMKFLTFLRMLPPEAMPEMPRGDLDRDWDNYCRMLPLANDAGVNIVPGDDYGGGPMPHRAGIYSEELSIYANEVGVKPLDVLRWATRNGAQLSGEPVGEIREGMLADLLVVDGDPSSDITILEQPENIRAVMLDGRFLKEEVPPAAT
jgi:imidazolonepropionase-like amidohydrolase